MSITFNTAALTPSRNYQTAGKTGANNLGFGQVRDFDGERAKEMARRHYNNFIKKHPETPCVLAKKTIYTVAFDDPTSKDANELLIGSIGRTVPNNLELIAAKNCC